MQWASRMRVRWLERAMAALDSLAQRRGRVSVHAAHLLTGIDGEEAACFYLLRKGYTVVARRWSSGDQAGDLDLVAWQGPLLCFFEVKTRTARDMNPAESAVDVHKRDVIRRLARNYVRQLSIRVRPQARFDVISVYLLPGRAAEFTHFENAFTWRESGGARNWD